jgi:tetratricopeptide (TPR) repeat protein
MEIRNIRLEIEEQIEKIEETHFFEKNYKKVIQLCNDLISMLDKKQDKYNMWKCYNFIAKAYLQLKEVKKSIEYARIANWFAENESAERTDNMDILARCYSNLGDIKLATKCFDKCITIYRSTNIRRGLARALNNKANKIVNYEEAIDDMKESISIYIDLLKTGEMKSNYYYILDDAYFNLCELYIKKDKIGRVYEVLNIMTNTEDIKEVKGMIHQALNVQQRKVVGI